MSDFKVFFVLFSLSLGLAGCSNLGGNLSKPEIASEELRLEMVQHIVNFEARRDSRGKIIVYMLPKGDGGGRYEVAGINERYHPAEAARLRRLVEAGRPEEAEAEAVKYIAGKTDYPANAASRNSIKFLLRDIAWNRGPTGAVRTLQIALGVQADGKIGPQTRAALKAAEQEPRQLVLDIRSAREAYERSRGRDETSKFWQGLVNRWDKASRQARRYN